MNSDCNPELKLIIDAIRKSIIQISNLLRTYVPTGYSNKTNKSGDLVSHIDIQSNEIVKNNLKWIQSVYALSSEEEDSILHLNHDGKYVVVFDPLDGSQNLDCHLTTGSIFGIFLKHPGKLIYDLSGKDMIYASYGLYSSATIYVECLNQCTLSILSSDNTFQLLQENIKMPEQSKYYYVNHSNKNRMNKETTQLINKFMDNKKTNRWTGCMVADVHRLVMTGGFFCYPADSKNTRGKLRVVYEILPMSYIVEKCGGQSRVSLGNNDSALDSLIGDEIHRKSPIYLAGSNNIGI